MEKTKKLVVLGVTGSISAYKACELVRLFVKSGYAVQVVMSANACKFVTALTFQTLSQNPVACDLFAAQENWKPGHIALAQAADLVVVAPATANILAKMAHGFADDLLSSTLLATAKPVLVAPAMNVGMYENAATAENFRILRSRGVKFVESGVGELACGTSGKGRMAEPGEIFAAASAMLGAS